ncbi:TrkH family potassium uptake protein [Bacillus aquiflavi]|uniref:TrkH family potassium uptake protein n=1 Tax=Bacillus aquiflavi TaxID=2672567 RepID=A0A6B3VX99_9BACI|nr:TrkH family potassium uptake protein [Bacillus aquiflavi]MBA4537355.1 TrkH family potassium uptake protein [Bacillus aquiflavi]NEY81612.1 TrkH family potassium uptake protein [Bacillus aquiflavi]UAC49969.1 TrkH family potassium uptake protein [Bacillus aquiflavi]
MKKAREKKFTQLTPARAIVGYYLVAVSVSVLLLSLPAAHKEGVKVSFLDTLFTAVSAVSVTGLTVVDLSETYSTLGIFILIFVLQLGAFGVMSLGTFLWLLFGKKIGLKSRKLIMVDQNQGNLSGLVYLIKEILKIVIGIELTGAAVLGVYFLNYFDTWTEAFYHGLFAAVSATTNAGFDITGASLIPFADDYFVQFIVIILITLGAIGFPVLVEVKAFLSRKKTNMRFRFSLFTKVTTVTFASLLIFGIIMIFVLEFQHFFSDVSWHKAFFYSFFQSASSRSAGLATLDISEFSSSTLLVMGSLMFIGASPSSVGGGIRTTTFAIVILFLFHFARGNRSIKIFKREIHDVDISKALAVMILAVFMCFAAIVILSITEKGHSLLEIVFEVCSAFGTVGYSMGITPDLSTIGKFIIMSLMFIGRIGLLSFLFMIGGTEKKTNYHYPKERIIIG